MTKRNIPQNINTEAIIKELHRAFKVFNAELFGNKLPEPAILIQSKGNRKSCLGWCTVDKVWVNAETQEERYEINLVAEYLNRGLLPVMATLLHEMVHLYNLVNGKKDVSRGGTYHNKVFKEVAENHGLIIEHDEKIGWSLTSLQQSTITLIHRAGLLEEVFQVSRKDFGEAEKKKKKSNNKKWYCPSCGQSVRATKQVAIICACCLQATGEMSLFVCDDMDEDEGEDTDSLTPVEDTTEDTVETPEEETPEEETPEEDDTVEPVETIETVETPVDAVEEPTEEWTEETIRNVLDYMNTEAVEQGYPDTNPNSLPIQFSDKMKAWAKYNDGKWFGFSTHFLEEETEENILETIKHLFCHHLDYVVNGKKNNHQKPFKAICEKLGVDSNPLMGKVSHAPFR